MMINMYATLRNLTSFSAGFYLKNNAQQCIAFRQDQFDIVPLQLSVLPSFEQCMKQRTNRLTKKGKKKVNSVSH